MVLFKTRFLCAALAAGLALAFALGCGEKEPGAGELCGNGVIDPGEECDGEDLGGATCEDLGYYGGELACGDDCTFDESGCHGYCGDGVLDAEHGEECDGEDLGGATCEDLGYYGGELACGDDCTFDESGCESGFCGDGIRNGPEECDGEDLGGESCESLGYYGGGELACLDDCTFDVSGCIGGYCGDGEIQVEYEECDGDDLGGVTCRDLGYYFGELGCTEECEFDDSGCGGYCGDGEVHTEHGEVCDDGVNDGVYGCMPDCTDFASKYCGDGDVHTEHGEECDGDNLLETTCEDLGYDGGTLVCGDDCRFDASGCHHLFSCGDTLVDPRDDKEYETIDLAGTCWMARNLDIGARIDSSEGQFDQEVIEKYCYDDDPAMCDVYGGLYQWNQAMDYSNEEGAQGICPDGWRIPSDDEWKELEMFLGMTEVEADSTGWRGEGAGEALKEGGSSGFEGLLGGAWRTTFFSAIDAYGYWWTSSNPAESMYPWRRCLRAQGGDVARYDTFPSSFGLSVRCVLD